MFQQKGTQDLVAVTSVCYAKVRLKYKIHLATLSLALSLKLSPVLAPVFIPKENKREEPLDYLTKGSAIRN